MKGVEASAVAARTRILDMDSPVFAARARSVAYSSEERVTVNWRRLIPRSLRGRRRPDREASESTFIAAPFIISSVQRPQRGSHDQCARVSATRPAQKLIVHGLYLACSACADAHPTGVR